MNNEAGYLVILFSSLIRHSDFVIRHLHDKVGILPHAFIGLSKGK